MQNWLERDLWSSCLRYRITIARMEITGKWMTRGCLVWWKQLGRRVRTPGLLSQLSHSLGSPCSHSSICKWSLSSQPALIFRDSKFMKRKEKVPQAGNLRPGHHALAVAVILRKNSPFSHKYLSVLQGSVHCPMIENECSITPALKKLTI